MTEWVDDRTYVVDEEPVKAPDPSTPHIAEQVRAFRRANSLNQQELADRMASLGAQWSRTTVINLERRAAGSRTRSTSATPGRESVTAQELIWLATSLNVTVVDLLGEFAEPAVEPMARAKVLAFQLHYLLNGEEETS